NYVYQYKDHLGNNRLSYATTTQASQTQLTILEESHYYPFGLKHAPYNNDHYQFTPPANGNNVALLPAGQTGNYQYKYNGKELQDELGLNIYDYGMMMYDPAIGRRNNIDPKAEQMRRWSTYAYCFNNPMRFTDPDGMKPVDWYLNKFTGNVTWKEGTGSKLGYVNLGHHWGHSDARGNRFQMDGDTKQITYNGKVLYDYNKDKSGSYGGFAFSDGGNNQNPSELRKGGRDVEWIDFKRNVRFN
ncbi:RHS repeat-associated core domain-containing protein, partial [Flavobacterium cucumis]